MPTPACNNRSRLRFHPLTVRPEDDEFIVGRIETGTFASFPEIGVRALELLREGMSLEQAEVRLTAADGSTVDLQDFAAQLLHLGFVAAVDETPIDGPEAAPVHLGWLQPRHVRWIFSPPMTALFLILLTSAGITILRRPDLIPRPSDFFLSPFLSLVLLANLVLGYFHVGIHEIAHLVAARAQGIPAHIRPGTRLHNLVLQTDVSGAWSLPRSARYRIYLAGILWDLAALSLVILAMAYAGLPPGLQGVLAAWALFIAFGLLGEFSFYMRTDIYFVVLDLMRSRNLFQEARQWLGYCVHRMVRLFRAPGGAPPPHPLQALPANERRKIAGYALLLLLGSTVALSRYFLIGVPILLQLISQSFDGVVVGLRAGESTRLLDGGFALLALLGSQLVFVVVFVRGRRRALASFFDRVRRALPIPAGSALRRRQDTAA